MKNALIEILFMFIILLFTSVLLEFGEHRNLNNYFDRPAWCLGLMLLFSVTGGLIVHYFKRKGYEKQGREP